LRVLSGKCRSICGNYSPNTCIKKVAQQHGPKQVELIFIGIGSQILITQTFQLNTTN